MVIGIIFHIWVSITTFPQPILIWNQIESGIQNLIFDFTSIFYPLSYLIDAQYNWFISSASCWSTNRLKLKSANKLFVDKKTFRIELWKPTLKPINA